MATSVVQPQTRHMQAACLSLIDDTCSALHYAYSKLSTLLAWIQCRAELQRNQQEDWHQHDNTQTQQGVRSSMSPAHNNNHPHHSVHCTRSPGQHNSTQRTLIV